MAMFTKSVDLEKAPVISSKRKQELLHFLKSAQLKFKDLSLLNLAFTHRSYAHESSENLDNNERLEFLGDSVLGLIVSDWLLRNLPRRHEGDFSRIKSYVVNEDSLAELAKALNVDRYVLIGKGEELSGGRQKKTILADCMEAIIGAYYLDQGFALSQKFVLRIIVPEIRKVLENKHKRDYKTLLQEQVQKRFKHYPEYHLVKKTGPEHANIFWVAVKVNGATYGPLSGSNKKDAEQQVAELAYTTLFGKGSDL